MAKRVAIHTTGAPEAIGPYVQAIRSSGLLFCSGQIPLDPETGILVPGDAAAQAQRCLLSLEAVAREAGASLANAVKTTIYLTNLADFEKVNAVYEAFVGKPAPARVTVQVAALPKGASVEIDAIIALG